MKARLLSEPGELDSYKPDIADTALESWGGARGARFIYLSVDIDVLDPGFAPGTGTPEPGGMQPADLLRALRKIVLRTNRTSMRSPRSWRAACAM